ncbi:hypothetical protein BP5796_01154 [Coleophoma crateriformis]|uniref:N-acetyltransferase domain-containing protein n=1 Tax=Coleophoma crateriformis TaxID=565419 RepID=A0A3D8SZQ5_9HELO|nr:hypothetical protein BP5796_01154 [Coleophoma crateriformis]
MVYKDGSNPDHTDCELAILNSATAHAKMGDYGIRTPQQLNDLHETLKVRNVKYHGLPTEIDPNMMVRLGDKDGPLIGTVSLAERSKELPPDMGWGFIEGQMGMGYATEASRELLRFLTTDCGIKEILVWPDPENIASNRVAQKLGFVPGGDVIDLDKEGKLVPVLILPDMKKQDGTKSVSFYGDGGSK